MMAWKLCTIQAASSHLFHTPPVVCVGGREHTEEVTAWQVLGSAGVFASANLSTSRRLAAWQCASSSMRKCTSRHRQTRRDLRACLCGPLVAEGALSLLQCRQSRCGHSANVSCIRRIWLLRALRSQGELHGVGGDAAPCREDVHAPTIRDPVGTRRSNTFKQAGTSACWYRMSQQRTRAWWYRAVGCRAVIDRIFANPFAAEESSAVL